MTVGCNDMSKFTEGSWHAVTANNERAFRTLKPSAQKNEFLVIFCKFAHCFSSALRYVFHRACPSSASNNAADALPHMLQSSRQFYRLLVSKNQEIIIFTAKKTYGMWLFRSRH